jgi:hypothetical protein
MSEDSRHALRLDKLYAAILNEERSGVGPARL